MIISFVMMPELHSYLFHIVRYSRGDMPCRRVKKCVKAAGSAKCSCSDICLMLSDDVRNR